MATGLITLKSLVFLLFELPPPMGRINRYDLIREQEEDNKEKSHERYLVHDAKGIVVKKKHALALLKDLKIKVHSDPIK